MSINRIGAAGVVSREQGSAAHDAIADADARDVKPPRNAKVEEVAKMYEKQFLGEMFKAMRATVTHTEAPSMAENIYQDQLDDKYVDAWGERGGIGLSDLIYDQIMERYFGGDTAAQMRKQGPVALTDRDVVNVARMKPAAVGSNVSVGAQVPLQIEVKPAAAGGPAKIQAPWDAKVVQSVKMDGGKTAVTLEHGAGLRSTLVFDGVPSSEIKTGQALSKGQTIGVLNPDAKSFLWNLNQPSAAKDGPL